MAQIEVFQRYLYIVQLLMKRPASLEQIQDYLEQQSDFDGRSYTCSRRTFLRDKEAILSLFKIEIRYNEQLRQYEIDEEDEMQPVAARLVEAFSTFQALQFNQRVPDGIQFERQKPRGIEYFRIILQAITQQREIAFAYTKFDTAQAERRLLQPYLLKEYKKRWYVIGRDSTKGLIRTFGLDRMDDVRCLAKGFAPDSQFDAERYFRNAFGVIYAPEEEVEEVVLLFDAGTGNYVKTMPLHSSQEILEDNAHGLKLKLLLYPSRDFVGELLSYGAGVKVLAPQHLAEAVKSELKKALFNYETH
ncbi:MAG TPA: WYL domain-containing protein [Edaphocola sp.]|nr:WYL domain-containing protein [Edaphocola sp.]